MPPGAPQPQQMPERQPIPGVKNARQAQDNAGALGWRLQDDEVRALDDVSNSL